MQSIVISLTDTLAHRVEARPIPTFPKPLRVPLAEAEEVGAQDLGYAEGQSFVIEYVNSAEEPSTRQITVIKIKAGAAGVPLLYAKCHQRQRVVCFRVDRIKSCIDFDGEVFSDVPGFLFENFGMNVDLARRTSDSEDVKNWNRFRASHSAHLVVMAALSHADAHMIDTEVMEIIRFAAWEAERAGIHTTEAFERMVSSFVRRLRPDREHILLALRAMQDEDPTKLMRFFRAAISVIDADGLRHPEERALLNQLALELIGTPVI